MSISRSRKWINGLVDSVKLFLAYVVILAGACISAVIFAFLLWMGFYNVYFWLLN